MEADQREAKRAKTNTKATREEFLSHFEDVLNDILSYDKANEQVGCSLLGQSLWRITVSLPREVTPIFPAAFVCIGAP